MARASTVTGCKKLPASLISPPTHADSCAAHSHLSPQRPTRLAHHLHKHPPRLQRAWRPAYATYILVLLLTLRACCPTSATPHTAREHAVTHATTLANATRRSLADRVKLTKAQAHPLLKPRSGPSNTDAQRVQHQELAQTVAGNVNLLPVAGTATPKAFWPDLPLYNISQDTFHHRQLTSLNITYGPEILGEPQSEMLFKKLNPAAPAPAAQVTPLRAATQNLAAAQNMPEAAVGKLQESPLNMHHYNTTDLGNSRRGITGLQMRLQGIAQAPRAINKRPTCAAAVCTNCNERHVSPALCRTPCAESRCSKTEPSCGHYCGPGSPQLSTDEWQVPAHDSQRMMQGIDDVGHYCPKHTAVFTATSVIAMLMLMVPVASWTLGEHCMLWNSMCGTRYHRVALACEWRASRRWPARNYVARTRLNHLATHDSIWYMRKCWMMGALLLIHHLPGTAAAAQTHQAPDTDTMGACSMDAGCLPSMLCNDWALHIIALASWWQQHTHQSGALLTPASHRIQARIVLCLELPLTHPDGTVATPTERVRGPDRPGHTSPGIIHHLHTQPLGGGRAPHRRTHTRTPIPGANTDRRHVATWLQRIKEAYNAAGGIQPGPLPNTYSVHTSVVEACQQAWAATAVHWPSAPTLTYNSLAHTHARDDSYRRGLHVMRPDWVPLTSGHGSSGGRHATAATVLHSTGDGNCFFNAVSILLQGNENLSLLLRLHTAVEILLHLDKYLDGQNPIYCRYSEPSNVQTDADQYLQQLLMGQGSYVTSNQAIPLASVLQRDVHVFCPLNTCSDILFSSATVHTSVQGVAQSNLPITLAWTHTQYNARQSRITSLNHFVPVAGTAATHAEGALHSPQDRAAGTTTLSPTRLRAQPPLAPHRDESAAGVCEQNTQDSATGVLQPPATYMAPLETHPTERSISDTAEGRDPHVAGAAQAPEKTRKAGQPPPAETDMPTCNVQARRQACPTGTRAIPQQNRQHTTTRKAAPHLPGQQRITSFFHKGGPPPVNGHSHCPQPGVPQPEVPVPPVKEATETGHGTEFAQGCQQPTLDASHTSEGAPKEFRVATINIRGVQNAVDDIDNILEDCNMPDVLILTETKRRTARQWLPKQLHRQYAAYHSVNAHGTAGIMMLVKRAYCNRGKVQKYQMPVECAGYLLHVSFAMPHMRTLHMVGAYMPGDITCRQNREAAYTCLTKVLQQTPPADTVVLSGDWNATLYDSDRLAVATSMDTTHRKWVRRHLGLASVYCHPGQRQPTFSVAGLGQSPSMIDDTLLRVPTTVNPAAAIYNATITGTHGYNTDHALLSLTLDARLLNIPSTDQLAQQQTNQGAPPTRRLITPIPKQHQEAFRSRLLAEESANVSSLSMQLSAMLAETDAHMASIAGVDAREIHRLDTLCGKPARQMVEATAHTLLQLILTAQHIAMQTCPTRITNPTGQHYRPGSIRRKRKRHMLLLKDARQLAGKARQSHTEQELQAHLSELASLNAKLAASEANATASADNDRPCPGQAACPANSRDVLLREVKETAAQVSNKIKQMDQEHRQQSIQAAQERLTHLLSTKPKAGHKMLFDNEDPQPKLDAVLDPASGHITTEPERVKQVVAEIFAEQQKAPTGTKTGKYLPRDAPRNHPWAHATGALDPFELCTDATQLTTRPWLYEYIRDEAIFFSCCKTLSNGKAPGPDGITNEVLKMLPVQIKKLVHKMFVVMWATGVTPAEWKHSHTCMIYKKGEPTNPKNYRPIGLANTVYKLWTRLVTYVMYEYAEEHRIISGTQAGFRKNTSTHKQLQMLIMAIEDARLTAQDLYTMQVDFSSAFNMTDHDTTLQTLYDLGFPTDAIEVVKDIYTGATTAYKTEHGLTGPVKIDRGTLQGDTLSPFLFLMYIEPLLRWLQVGGRGYQFGCLPKEHRMQMSCSNLTYADDLAVLVTSLPDLHAQADKLTMFSDWGHMKVNTTKTIVSGVLNSNPSSGLLGHRKTVDHQVLRNRLADTVYVQGTPVKFVQPDEPFRYLGVETTLTLDWKPQYATMLQKLKDKCRRLRSSRIPAGTKMRIVQTVLKPKISYGFSVAPYMPAQLKAFDSQLAAVVKHAYGQRHAMPTAMVMEDKNKFGLGLTSLLVDYNTICVKNLVEALNDPTAYGTISRQLLQLQAKQSAYLTADQLQGVARGLMRVRQLSAAQQSGLCIWKASTNELMALGGTDLTRLVESLMADELGMGLPAHIPPKLLTPLISIGVTSIDDVLTKKGTRVISTTDLKLRYGRQVKAAQLHALRRLTQLLHNDGAHVAAGQKLRARHANAVALSATDRLIHVAHLPAIAAARAAATDACFNQILHPVRRGSRDQDIVDLLQMHDATRASADAQQRRHHRHASKPSKAQTHLRPKCRRRKQAQPNEHRCSIPEPADITTTNNNAVLHTRCERAMRVWDVPEGDTLPTTEAAARALQETNCTHELVEILGWRMVTNRVHQKGTKATEKHSQVQYLVSWQPTLAEEWEMLAFQACGYAVQSKQPVTFEDLATNAELSPFYEELACEVCNRPDPHADLVVCDDCQRLYHWNCAQLAGPPGQDEPWACNYCCRTRQRRSCRADAPADRSAKLYIVRWAPTWEPADKVPDALVNDWRARQQAQMQRCRPDAHLTELERQGVYGANTYAAHMTDTARHNVTVEHQPLDPHTDTAPTHNYELEIRDVPRTYQSDDGMRTVTTSVACCLGTDGRCVGMVEPQRLQLLWDRWQHTLRHHPDVVASLHPRTFQEEVYRLLLRYRDGADRDDCGRRLKTRNHWATPREVMQVLQQHMGVTTERFASPLNFNQDMSDYWSCHERDQLFGARWNSYSCKWRGASQANPEYEHEEMARAVRWALASAQTTDEPVLTTFILPAWDNRNNRTSYMRYIDQYPAHCHVLMRIHRRHFAFCHPDAWKGYRIHTGHPKWDINVVLVGNLAGMERARSIDCAALSIHMINALRTVQGRTDSPPAVRTAAVHLRLRPVRTNPGHPATVDVPRRFRKLPTETSAVCGAPATGIHGSWEDVRGLFAARRPLLVDAASLVYTDGSVTTTHMLHPCINENGNSSLAPQPIITAGSGVYVPGQRLDTTRGGGVPATGRQIAVDPGSGDTVPTITRAEGAAIWYALSAGLGTAIATDSATLLYQISNMLMKPHTMRHNSNMALVAEIVDMIRASPAPIKLYKVKAHTGIPGNEYADEAARQAAARMTRAAALHSSEGSMETEDSLPVCTASAEPPSHAMLWPWVSSSQPAQVAAAMAEPPAEWQPELAAQDLRKHLKAEVHKKARLGYSNTNSIYYKSWMQTLPQADAAASNAFMHTCGDTDAACSRKLALQYRTGGLNTAKFRYRMNKSSSPNCELCGQADGGHHSLSGCPNMSGLYTDRHNGAGKIILRYVAKGSKGGMVVMHDVGKHGTPTLQGGNAVAPRIPAWVYSCTGQLHAAPDRQQWNKYRPDVLLVTGGRSTPMARRHVHIVEVKYCRDTDRQQQEHRAQAQHAGLAEHLARVGYRQSRIHQHTVLLGVGGTIYKDMYKTLQRLGVDKRRGRLLAAKLHRHAIAYAKIIMHTKWHQESHCQKTRTGVG